MKEIIERVGFLRETIDVAFENGRIDFDAISQELDSISNELQLRDRLALNKERQITANTQIVAGDFR